MRHWFRCLLPAVFVLSAATSTCLAQPAPAADAARLHDKLDELRAGIDALRAEQRPDGETRRSVDERALADVEVCAKAAEWILRHEEFYRPGYVGQTERALDLGLERLEELKRGEPGWLTRPGRTVRGYVSQVDGSVQPYAVTLPEGVDPRAAQRWPVYIELHGRQAQMNEVNFIHRHEGQPARDGQNWIQIDVFGRMNNAYRWAGETDVFEALDDVRRRFRVDDRRITLWGFSMGGAGAWHLGLHYPSEWASVGAGAGFVDFYKYQNQQERLPDHQHRTLHIYDAVDYALNAFNVPVVTYGGELDKQIAASHRMIEAAGEHGLELKFLIGPQTEHRFHPDSFREFMEFHLKHNEKGRPAYPGAREVRFMTWTPKYNECDWVTVEELIRMYEPATVEGRVEDDGTLRVKTQNVAVLQIARDVASSIELDGDRLPLINAADGLLPGVYYELASDGWQVLDYRSSRQFTSNPDRRKRRNLQGPIDDAFMQPFVCVRGTGAAWSEETAAWSSWTLDRFSREFDQYLRGRAPVVDDTAVDDELIAANNLILFGDPGSNALIAKVLDGLPVTWTTDAIEVGGKRYDPKMHGLSLIYPNPLNPSRYVVINSGHTFHARDFRASNAWLFPRLGDIAVQKFSKTDDGYDEEVAWAALFDSSWRLPRAEPEPSGGEPQETPAHRE